MNALVRCTIPLPADWEVALGLNKAQSVAEEGCVLGCGVTPDERDLFEAHYNPRGRRQDKFDIFNPRYKGRDRRRSAMQGSLYDPDLPEECRIKAKNHRQMVFHASYPALFIGLDEEIEDSIQEREEEAAYWAALNGDDGGFFDDDLRHDDMADWPDEEPFEFDDEVWDSFHDDWRGYPYY